MALTHISHVRVDDFADGVMPVSSPAKHQAKKSDDPIPGSGLVTPHSPATARRRSMFRTKLALAAIGGTPALVTSPGVAVDAPDDNRLLSLVVVGTSGGTVVANGPIDVGSATTNRAELPPGEPFHATFSFPPGDSRITGLPVQPQIRFTPTTCATTFAGDAASVATGGTNQLAGASGRGTLTTNTATSALRSAAGTWREPDPPALFQVPVIRHPGDLSLGSQ